jgi:small conductance mechanosensitive channel
VTKLRGQGGEIWYIRNGEVKRIANMSQGWATANVEVPVHYDSDLDLVERLILAAGEEMGKEDEWSELLWEPVKILGVDSLAGDAVLLHVQAKTQPGKSLSVARELRRRIKLALDAEGIRLAGAPELPDTPESVPAPRPAVEIAAPSALADPNSAQSRTASPLPSDKP